MVDDSPARVPYITSRKDVPKHLRDNFDAIAKSRGHVRGPFAVLMNSPETAGLVGALGEYIRFQSQLPAVVRELAIITTAYENKCTYEWKVHEPIAREVGVSESAIKTVKDNRSVGHLESRDASNIKFGRELFRNYAVSESTFSNAIQHFGEQGITELTVTMGYYSLVACILNAFEVSPADTSN